MNPLLRKGLPELLERAARLARQRVPAARRTALDRAVDEAAEGSSPLQLFLLAWRSAGLGGEPATLHNPSAADLPFVAWDPAQGWLLVQRRIADGSWQAESSAGTTLSLPGLSAAQCLSLPEVQQADAVPTALRLVGAAIWRRKGVFFDAVLATALGSLLALGTSLYSMQVYDRVIPNSGYNTLWVLSVGVLLSIALEFMLKQVRSHAVDTTCKAIDAELSEWFFRRMLGIRMEARPASVGTLASQVKGFEQVRAVLASTSLFVLADVPFAVLFVLVIGLIGGWIVLVPLVALPLALGCGLAFQKAIQRHTRNNLATSYKSAGLLVEAVDGAESVKASSSEGVLQSRWNRLVAEASIGEQAVRTHSSLSQNLTAMLQQVSYVLLVAVGAWLVTDNKLTMGALLACSIIGNRAMSPIIQLPGVMVQWAHARAAIEGIEKIISLPNEQDNAHEHLAPSLLGGDIGMERLRFSYGGAQRVALEVERMAIQQGDRVALIGPIGSGKSTLLKLASGLYRPAEGKIFLGGMDAALLAPAVVREHVGYLPQEARLFSGTLRDNLLLGLPDPGDEAILAAAQRTGLSDLILGQPRGLALEITEGGRGVSGGQRQLIAFTRMLLANPKVWLLDEPTGNMDSATEARVVQVLRDVAEQGATLLISTHKNAVMPLVDRIIVLQGGRVVADGPRNEVMARLAGRPATNATNGTNATQGAAA
ncbi:ATP-binding cassette domain-containing protein [Lacisediminimonas profundi]|uniref:ATP-binding cassette domain-containing protein n=1 Tax=Lacisediminimonas profundi TaxID=2603856 RepID=UPI001F4F8AE7|nr:ATP-binding cassette domain-containing protein [Lacisediminimonas profundi]